MKVNHLLKKMRNFDESDNTKKFICIDTSGYKDKGKKGKKEEIEKSDKTMTHKKPTKVEIVPQVK